MVDGCANEVISKEKVRNDDFMTIVKKSFQALKSLQIPPTCGSKDHIYGR